jgi:hypothetical protein
MVNSPDQGFFPAVGVRFGSDVDTHTMRFDDNTTVAHDNADEHEHVSLEQLTVNQYHR